MKNLFLTFSLLGLITPAWAQQAPGGAPVLDVQHYEIRAEVVPDESFVKGEVKIQFVLLEDSVSLPFELNTRLSLLGVRDQEDVSYSTSFDNFDSSRLRVRGSETFRKGTEMTLTFRFEGTLEKETYAFLDTPQAESAVIYPEGAMLLSEGNWFPSHRFPLDAATATVKITVPLGFSVVAPGEMRSIETLGISEVFTWESLRLLTRIPVVVARFFRQKFEDSSIPLTFYVTEAFDRDLRPFVDEVTQMLEFFRSEYGPLDVEALNFVQVSNVRLPSTGSAGLILLETSLLQSSSIPIMELARRVALQWWGYSLRPEASSDAWLQDGFATYAALRYFEVKHSDRFSTELAREAVSALKYESNAPVSKGLELQSGSAQYQSIVASKGAWILYMLGQLVGRERLDGLLGDWYRQKAQQPVNTAEFAAFIQERTGEDYRWFSCSGWNPWGSPSFASNIPFSNCGMAVSKFEVRSNRISSFFACPWRFGLRPRASLRTRS